MAIASGAGVAHAECEAVGGGYTYVPPAPTVAPTTVPVGGQVSVAATGLSRGGLYNVILYAADGTYAWSGVLGQAAPDSRGNIGPTSFTIPAGLISGAYDVRLASTDGQEETDTASITVRGDSETDSENIDESLTDGGETTVSGRDLQAKRREFETTTRPKYWKDEASKNPGKYAESDLERLRKGNAPTGSDGYPIELHHKTPLKRGGSNDVPNLEEMTRTRHRLGGNYRRNHPQ